jgi:hypothetical protein
MKRTKSLLKKFVAETAKRQRTCCHTGRDISAGSPCLVVFDGPRQRFCYSHEVGARMIEQARHELLALENALALKKFT